MQLAELVNSIHAIQVAGDVQKKNVSSICYDSRKVKRNSLFVAIKGFNSDGHKFISDAINNGAVAVILEDTSAIPDEIFIHENVVKIVVKDSRKALAEVSDALFDHPSKKIKLIGITGTNGKTTTTYFIKSILEAAGEKTGLIGTIKNWIGEKEIKSSLTTPESNDLNELFYEMKAEGCTYSIMEVSSHSLVLNRVYGLSFSSAIFTNITSDHLDFHQSFENYFEAKKILFDSLSPSAFAIYNSDDEHSRKIIKDTKANLISYGTSSNSDFKLKDVKYDLSGTTFSVEHKENTYPVSTSLIGRFNAYNACAAFATCYSYGFKEEIILKGIKNTKQVPGRFEVIGNKNKKVIVDYSHTADSLEKALLAVKDIVKNSGKIYTVFGCGGNRDKTKRPVMGNIASELSDFVIVTSDNPRFEDPNAIIKDIEAGITKKNFKAIENREEAISYAIKNSEKDAVILIAGKGHENYQEIKGVRNNFSDREVAEKYLD
ncbi:MAG TPA: UDP-N-acetylmuramoyl-L-alanyl-D-glutamate--2,6-diaminopimelate ligase [Ignavibacteriaceae bacterium]|nr:UDP-N-acetylmuramoyl-L-alanyl-D-glutamate--2,6-diaminopimelate ligase [Ignavibacteriaceae bacterium]